MNYANENNQRIKAYEVSNFSRSDYDGLLLDASERNTSVSPKVKKALIDYLRKDQLQLYPEYFGLNEAIAGYANVKSNQVLPVSGSDQGIDLIFRAFTQKNDQVIIPNPSFSIFNLMAGLNENEVIQMEYESDMSFPVNELINQINPSIKLLIICNPNNPTGTVVELSDLEKIIQVANQKQVLVYVDEAYSEFSDVTAASLIDQYPNLIITRTFSKAFGLAALRIGYVLSSVDNIEQLKKVRGPYDVNTMAVVAAKAALEDMSYVNDYVDEVMLNAKPSLEQFFEKNNIPFYESRANFILFQPKDVSKTYQKLKENGVLVRQMNNERLIGWLRVSIGTSDQMKSFQKIYTQLFLKS